MIPAKLRSTLGRSPASAQMRDAAAELAMRIELGEFDDLDEMQRQDLAWLSAMLLNWAERVHALEASLLDVLPSCTTEPTRPAN